MHEDLLHYIWRYRLYDHAELHSAGGDEINIIHPGVHNTNSGADFSNARIRIGDALMAGNVEIHIDADDWYAHGHHLDAAYNNVILHVVYKASNKPTMLASGLSVPVLDLDTYISQPLLNRYDLLRANTAAIPCEKILDSLPQDFSLPSFYDRLLIERLEAKTAIVEAMLKQCVNDWEQVAFQMVAMYFGASVNKESFGLLARSLPLAVLHRHRSTPMQVEALLFGQAGLLTADYDDDYPRELLREYTYLRKLHNLIPLEGHSWRFFRTRPVNFPTIKIAQLSALMLKEANLFSALLESRSIAALKKIFEVRIQSYWHSHYQFDKPAASAAASPGAMLTDVVLINAVVPLLFAYGRYKGDEATCDRALEMLQDISAENNAITRMWDSMGIKARTAADTQALLQLKTTYCDHKRCLECSLGHQLLQHAR